MGDAHRSDIARPRIRRRLRVIALGLVLLPSLALVLLVRAVSDADRQARQREQRERRERVQGDAQDLANRLGAREGLFPAEPRERFALREALEPLALARPIDVDGECSDWREAGLFDSAPCESGAVAFDRAWLLAEPDEGYAPSDFSFEILAGTREDHLFLFLRVTDEDLRLRRRSLDDGDQLRLVVSVPDGARAGVPARFVTTLEPRGEVTTYQVGLDWTQEIRPSRRLPWGDYQQPAYRRPYGFWRPQAGGYAIELRLPLRTLGAGWRAAELGLAVVDVDGPAEGASPPSRRAMWVVAQREGAFAPLAPDAGTVRRVFEEEALRERRIAVFDARGRELYAGFAPGEGERERGALLLAELREGEAPSLADASGAFAAARVVSDRGRLLGSVLEEQALPAPSPRLLAIAHESPVLAAMLSGTLVLLFLSLWYTRRLSRRILALVDDVAVERRADDEIGELSRRLSELVERVRADRSYLERLPAILGHETLGPLGVVKMYLDEVEESAPATSAGRYHAAQRALRSVEELIEDLREATSLEDALARGERVEVDLVEFLGDYLVAYGEAKGVVLEADLPAEGLRCEVIEGRIEQLLDKLLDNAVAFSDGSPVRVSLVPGAGEVRIRVENRGSRLPEGAAAEQIFEPMWSERKRTSERHLGMGLYVARVIAAHHGGTLAGWNEAPDRVVFEAVLRSA